MILDNETSLLYLSDNIRSRATFFAELSALLQSRKIQYHLLPNTRDIWAVDYMPVQVALDRFVQFRYQPDYLQSAKYITTQTDPDEVCKDIGLDRIHSNIILDGGNIIKGKKWAILTDKVFKENPLVPQKKIVAQLEELFDVKVIVIPREPYDFTGHADGMLRYYDEETLLINDYGNHLSVSYRARLAKVLASQGFKLITIPYAPNPSNLSSADGVYINFLEMKNFLLIPTFRNMADGKVVAIFEQLYPSSSIQTIDACDISKDGGVLHCISWPIATI
ncbi:MAG TPA: agmatine deiminase family protein [Ohtaekwangia sp.]|nr:agmatine deiminase family protein [Ohtaekwangia sp.]